MNNSVTVLKWWKLTQVDKRRITVEKSLQKGRISLSGSRTFKKTKALCFTSWSMTRTGLSTHLPYFGVCLIHVRSWIKLKGVMPFQIYVHIAKINRRVLIWLLFYFKLIQAAL